MKSSPRDPPPYQSYLLRFWLDTTTNKWRATLQSVQTGEQRHFQNIQTLCQFLEQQGTPNHDQKTSPTLYCPHT